MRYPTYDDLQRVSADLRKSEAGLIKEAMDLSTKRVFLSHSSLDRAILPRVLAFFDKFKAPAYIDKEDDDLPSITSAQTALRLTESMKTCPRFVLAATENIRASRWTPWELGYAHGVKGRRNVAILPPTPRGRVSAVEQEYLELYPVICKETLKGDDEESWCVRNPENGNFWRLEYWLFN